MTDGVVTIRPPAAGDSERLIAGRDAEFARWLGPGADDPQPTACVVVAGAVVGWVDFDTDRTWLRAGEVNVGYFMFALHRGNGYASRALALLLRYLDEATEFHTPTLLIHPENAASHAVAIRSGFVARRAVDGSLFLTRAVDGTATPWQFGDVIARREISWGRPCFALPVRVVEDSDAVLATYIPERAPMSYAEYPDLVWPTESGRHPWWPRAAWEGNGVLMLQRPGEHYAVWHFWAGDDRHFECWYLNIQEPFRRTPIGIDTQDLELDVVVLEDGQWCFKDEEKLDGHLETGRYSAVEVESTRQTGREIATMLDAGERWWDDSLRSWRPDPSWTTPDPLFHAWPSVPWVTAAPSDHGH